MERVPLSDRLEVLGALPARSAAGSGKKRPAPLPLARRLAALQDPRAGWSRGFFAGFGTYFHGVSVLSRGPEPERRAGELAERFRIPPNMRLAALVRYAFHLDGEDFPQECNEILYSLLIKPFGRMGCLPKNGRLNPPDDGDDDLPF